MRRPLVSALTVLAVLGAAPAARAQDAPGDPEVRVTAAGFRVAPAGREFGVSRFASGFQGPLGAALSPNGRWLLAASSGAARQESADLFGLHAGARTDAIYYEAITAAGVPGESAFYGVAFSPDGRRAWVSGGGQQVVHVLDVDGRTGRLAEVGQIPVTGFAAGLAYGVTPRGPRLYVAQNTLPDAVQTATPPTFGMNAPGHEVTVIDPATSTVVNRIHLGASLQPLGVAFSRDGRSVLVTHWIGRRVSVIDTATETVRGAPVRLSRNPLAADHPSAIAANPARDEAYTANANSDTVSVLDSGTGEVRATIPVGVVPGGPKGSTPDGLAVAPDGRTLYVALAGENALAVVDLDARRVRGFIPTSWYPADVDVTADGRRLVVTNTNASGAGPNPCGPLTPHPATICPPRDDEQRDDPRRPSIDPQFSGSMIKGSVQVVRVPGAARLARLTDQVRRNDQVAPRSQPRPAGAGRIKHVIYVIKENRTYDQVLGDARGGNGDRSLTLFGPDSAPNHHELARRFGLYDNFYADAEVSADGHNWATQANATDYVEKTWPVNYSPGNRSRQRGYDFEDAMGYPTEPLPADRSVLRPAAAQTVGYLWDNAWAHRVSYRSYGEYVPLGIGTTCSPGPYASSVTHLQARFGAPVAPAYPGYNLFCSDHVNRYPAWAAEFDRFVAEGNLPQLEIVRLPSDHTQGTIPGRATPQAYVADNDLALGRMVDKLSHSRYWRDTAMLVTEDDAQNGPDHVDAHRTLAYVISAYTQGARGARVRVDSTHYDTASMVATVEALLGLPPMSIVDQRVSRMWRGWSARPRLRPYQALTPRVVPFGDPGAPVNPPTAPMARASRSWNFAKEDATPEIGLNRAIWKSIRGREARMPAPRHERIIGTRANDEEEDGE
jgi:YVTN family beta-propeller protein